MHPGELAFPQRRKQIDSDLVHRSSAGGFVYLGFLAALWATTDYFASHRVLLAAISTVSVVCGCGRLLLGHRFARLYARNAAAWRAAYFAAVDLNILVWGLFLAATFLRFGYSDWKTLLVLICLAGTAPIAMAALTPDLLILRSFFYALTLPMIGANVYVGGTRGYTMAAVFSWYLLFALAHARIIHNQYIRYLQERFALVEAKKSAERLSQVKSEFLANMSHELRTPMNAILGMTHLALNSSRDAGQRKYLQMVTASGEKLLQMLNGLLDFSKIEAGKLEMENIPFSVLELVDETIRSFSRDLQTRGVRLSAHVEEDVPSRLCGDPLRLRQVLVNVVGNAAKFTQEGEIEVQVSRLVDHAEGVALQFLVRDTGVGIPAGKQRSIFEAFEQADSSTAREYGGTGLGLAIASKIVGLMGGRMWVVSQPGHGSSFYWTARLARPALEQEPPPEHLEQAAIQQARAPLRVLVAEDHEISRELMKKLLEMRGHEVTAVCNGTRVLEEMERQAFDLVLMDLHMSGMDGLAATDEIRRKEQGRPPLPVIALTVDVAPGIRERCLAAGFTEYLAKPFKPEVLYELIERLGKPAATHKAAT